MSFTRRVALVAAVGFVLAAPGVAAGDDKKPATDDEAVKAFVAYLAKNEIKLEPDKDGGWMVTDPKGDGWRVVVYFKTFPEGTSEKDMQKALSMINLAFMLNAPTRLAMSHPGLRGGEPGKHPKLDDVPVIVKLKKLFTDYKPPEPKK